MTKNNFYANIKKEAKFNRQKRFLSLMKHKNLTPLENDILIYWRKSYGNEAY